MKRADSLSPYSLCYLTKTIELFGNIISGHRHFPSYSAGQVNHNSKGVAAELVVQVLIAILNFLPQLLFGRQTVFRILLNQ